jgi:hypothetical protein
MIGKCDRSGCIGAGIWQPIIEVWAIGAEQASDPARIALHLRVCQQHREVLALDDYLGQMGLAALSDALAAMGAARPDAATARMAFRPIQNTEMQ